LVGPHPDRLAAADADGGLIVSEAEKIIVLRTGQPPLRFAGELAAEASSKEHQGPLQNRWHEIAVYRTAGGKLVASVVFRTIWQGEHDAHWARLAERDKALIDDLQNDYDPTAGWTGHPTGAMDAERKNALLREAIVGGYQRCLTAVFEKLNLAEEVE
jgi:hypothetical protein